MRSRVTLEFDVEPARDAAGLICGVEFESLHAAVRQAWLSSPPEGREPVARLSFGADPSLTTYAVLSLSWDEDY